jgi:hypothetical protein
MKAGEIEITVAANYAALDAQMKQVVASTTAAGGAAADGFGDKFNANLKRHIETSANQIKMQLVKAAGALAIANALKTGLQAGAEGADFTTSLTNAIKSVPIVSTVYEIFAAVGSLVTGEAKKNAEIMEAEAEAAAIRARIKFREAQAAGVAGAQEDITRLSNQDQIEQAKREANARKVAQIQARQEIHDLEMRKQRDLLNAKSEQEKELIRERTVLEFGMIERRLNDEYALIEAADKEKQQKAADAAAKQAAEADAEVREMIEYMNATAESAAEELAQQSQKELEALDKELQSLDEQRAAAGRETGSTQTSFGVFKFQAYTEDEKKQVDASILRQIEQINRKASEIARGGIV